MTMANKGRKQTRFGALLAGYVASELARAGKLLGRKPGRLNVGIHQGRKSLRRSRAAIALAGDALGPGAARIDRALRGLCRSLSRERDAQAIIDTLTSAAADASTGIQDDDLKQAQRLLTARRNALLAARLERDPGLTGLRERLAGIARRAAALPWAQVEASHVHAALARSLKRCDRAERRALELTTDAEALHRWRRRLRRLRQQLTALQKLTGLDWGEYAAVPDPADALSEAQDLAVLTATLRRLSGLDRDTRRRLLDALMPVT